MTILAWFNPLAGARSNAIRKLRTFATFRQTFEVRESEALLVDERPEPIHDRWRVRGLL